MIKKFFYYSKKSPTIVLKMDVNILVLDLEQDIL